MQYCRGTVPLYCSAPVVTDKGFNWEIKNKSDNRKIQLSGSSRKANRYGFWTLPFCFFSLSSVLHCRVTTPIRSFSPCGSGLREQRELFRIQESENYNRRFFFRNFRNVSAKKDTRAEAVGCAEKITANRLARRNIQPIQSSGDKISERKSGSDERKC